LDQVSPESICGGSGLEEPPEDAQAAEITIDARVSTRTPSFFFITTPLNRTPDNPLFGGEYTAAPAWIEAARLLQESFRFEPRRKETAFTWRGPMTRAPAITRFSRRDEFRGPATSNPHPPVNSSPNAGGSPLHYSRRFAVKENVGMARLAKLNKVGFFKALGRYRERVDLEIGKASEHGARWWSRRLVEVCQETGLVRLEK
jgi:hypothetical protein